MEHESRDDVRWTLGGRRGAVPNYKYGRNVKRSTCDLLNVWGLAYEV